MGSLGRFVLPPHLTIILECVDREEDIPVPRLAGSRQTNQYLDLYMNAFYSFKLVYRELPSSIILEPVENLSLHITYMYVYTCM